MSNQQLYLAIGIPGLLALINLVILLVFGFRLDSRIERLDSKIDSKIDGLRGELGAMINAVRNELGAKIESGQRDMREFYATQRQHDTRLEALERKVDPS